MERRDLWEVREEEGRVRREAGGNITLWRIIEVREKEIEMFDIEIKGEIRRKQKYVERLQCGVKEPKKCNAKLTHNLHSLLGVFRHFQVEN